MVPLWEYGIDNALKERFAVGDLAPAGNLPQNPGPERMRQWTFAWNPHRQTTLYTKTMPFKIFRYILVRFSGAFVAALLLFSALFLMDQASRQVEKLASLAQGLGDFIVSFLLLGPHLLAYTVPLAFLLAMIWTLEQMKQERELTAIMATGTSPITLFLPFLGASVAIAAAVFLIANFAGPASFRKYDERIGQMARRNVLAELRPGTFFTQIPGVVLLVGAFEPESGRIDGLMMVREDDQGKPGEMVTAQKGIVTTSSGEAGEILLNLEDGAIHPLAAAIPEYSSGTFRTMTSLIRTQPGSGESDTKRVLLGKSSLHLRSLLENRQKTEDFHETVDLSLELNRRLSIPVAVLLYPLIIFPVAVSIRHQGKALAFSGSLLLFIAAFLLNNLGSSMARENLVSPVFGAWLANLVLGVCGTVLFTVFALKQGPRGPRRETGEP